MMKLASSPLTHRIGADFAGLHLSNDAIGGLIIGVVALLVIWRLGRALHVSAVATRDAIAAYEAPAPRGAGGKIAAVVAVLVGGLWLYGKSHAAAVAGQAPPPAVTPKPAVTHIVTRTVTRAAAHATATAGHHLALSGADIVLIVVLGVVLMLGVAAITRRSD
jgi:hypothetical protein